jgi:23S rRNA (adenine2503-C2)-methyltransferase
VTSPVPPLARTPEEWVEALKTLGGRAFHARQVFRWLQGRSVLDASKMTDLPASLRDKLATLAIERTIEVADERRAADDTRKLLVRMRDGATVETVLIPGVTGPKGRLPSPVAAFAAMEEGDDDDPEDDAHGEPQGAAPAIRVTQCISTQVGCAQGCVFCASGVAGLKRNLGADEIIAQVLTGRARLD